DALHGPLRDADLDGHVAQTHLRVLGDAEEDVRMVGEKGPAVRMRQVAASEVVHEAPAKKERLIMRLVQRCPARGRFPQTFPPPLHDESLPKGRTCLRWPPDDGHNASGGSS